MHEGRIKKGGQFSYKSKVLVRMLKGAMLVNPDIMLKKINDKFEMHISMVKKEGNEFDNLKKYLEKFDEELNYANSC